MSTAGDKKFSRFLGDQVQVPCAWSPNRLTTTLTPIGETQEKVPFDAIKLLGVLVKGLRLIFLKWILYGIYSRLTAETISTSVYLNSFGLPCRGDKKLHLEIWISRQLHSLGEILLLQAGGRATNGWVSWFAGKKRDVTSRDRLKLTSDLNCVLLKVDLLKDVEKCLAYASLFFLPGIAFSAWMRSIRSFFEKHTHKKKHPAKDFLLFRDADAN